MAQMLTCLVVFVRNKNDYRYRLRLKDLELTTIMFWPVDPAKNAIQGDAPEVSDTL